MSGVGGNLVRQRYGLGLLIIVTSLTAIRLPSVWYRMGGQDEQWYTVPGWTVAGAGIPRIPYVTADDPGSVFQGASRILYALPPAYFYVQAPFFWVFEPGYGTARLASVLSGAGCLLLLYGLMRRLAVRPLIALACLPICALGRAFYFPWQDSRPDLLCAMFGLAAVLVALSAARSDQWRQVAVSGFLVGLGGLSHPYAVVFAIQVCGIFLFSSKSWKNRILACALTGVASLAGIALWLPLIALDPELFWAQFSSNVLSRSGPGLVSRVLWPWPFAHEQTRLIYERLGPYQVFMLFGTCLTGLLYALRRAQARFFPAEKLKAIAPLDSAGREPHPHALQAATQDMANYEHQNAPYNTVVTATCLGLSSLYLHVACLGLHPAQGYLCYPWALLVLLIACLLEATTREISRPGIRHLTITGCIAMLLVLLMPGSGLRATWTYATRNHETNYNRQEFCRQLNQRFPLGARLIVSPEFVFEFELLGRQPVNASRLELYQDVRGLPFDYLVASTQAFDEGIPDYLHCEPIWEFGDATDKLACYVKVFVPTSRTPNAAAWPR